jgi:hypothetical protein
MSSDNQYTALGDAIVGFQTNSTSIQRGAEISGSELGVHGNCDSGVGVLGTSQTDAGVRGESEKAAGAAGRGYPGVIGQSAHSSPHPLTKKDLPTIDVGVMGLADEDLGGVGVYGGTVGRGVNPSDLRRNDTSGAGVVGSSLKYPGVAGHSQTGNGIVGRSVKNAGVVGSSSDGKAGVMGLSQPRMSGEELPEPPWENGIPKAGVIGYSASTVGSDAGVVGLSSADGPGVLGKSTYGRGGVFEASTPDSGESRLRAQVQLVPQRMQVSKILPAAPVMFDSLEVVSLPSKGMAGDILATEDNDHVCTLWFCVRGYDRNTKEDALWCQILLGNPVPGRRWLGT